jgi:hypothetical protein
LLAAAICVVVVHGHVDFAITFIAKNVLTRRNAPEVDVITSVAETAYEHVVMENIGIISADVVENSARIAWAVVVENVISVVAVKIFN